MYWHDISILVISAPYLLSSLSLCLSLLSWTQLPSHSTLPYPHLHLLPSYLYVFSHICLSLISSHLSNRVIFNAVLLLIMYKLRVINKHQTTIVTSTVGFDLPHCGWTKFVVDPIQKWAYQILTFDLSSIIWRPGNWGLQFKEKDAKNMRWKRRGHARHFLF